MMNRRAFSLVEAALSIVVIGGLLAGTIQAVGQIGASRALAKAKTRSWPVATALLEELTALAYLDPAKSSSTIGLDAGEDGSDRTTWDDVDDAHGYKSTIVTRAGDPVAGCEDLGVSVTVDWVQLADGRTVSVSETGAKRITVVVSGAKGELARASALRTRAFDSAVNATLGRSIDPASRRQGDTIK